MSAELTIEGLLANTVEHGDCMVWAGYINGRNSPVISVNGRRVNVRVTILRLSTGRGIPPGRRLITTCRTWGCINPEHMQIMDTKKFITTVVVPRTNQAIKGAKSAMTQRRKSTLSDEEVKRLMVSDEPDDEAAARLGLTPSYIRDIRTGRSRRNYIANPWAGMGQR